MKNQALFSSKGKSKNLKCRLLQFLYGALRINTVTHRKSDTNAHGKFILITRRGWGGGIGDVKLLITTYQ